MYHIKYFMRELIYEDTTGNIAVLPPIITPKLPATRKFSVPDCEFCTMDRCKKRLDGATKVNPLL